MGKLGKTGVVSMTTMRQIVTAHIVALAAQAFRKFSDPGCVIGNDSYKEERKDATGTHILYSASGLAPAVASLFFLSVVPFKPLSTANRSKLGHCC